jgi:hypothetical protein
MNYRYCVQLYLMSELGFKTVVWEVILAKDIFVSVKTHFMVLSNFMFLKNPENFISFFSELENWRAPQYMLSHSWLQMVGYAVLM